MTLKELEKFIDEEVSKISISEPKKELPITPVKQIAPIFNPVLKNEDEIDEMLFKAGMKEK